MIRFDCPQCGEALTVPDSAAGQSGRCKFCNTSISAPPVIDSASENQLITADPRPNDIIDLRQSNLRHRQVGDRVSQAAEAASEATARAASSGLAGMRPPRQITPLPAATPPPLPQQNDDRGELLPCPFCDEPIRKAAKKCKHCGELLDIVLREASRAAAPVVPVKRWDRGTAIVLSFLIPGLGQIYKGQILNGIAWLFVTALGYASLIVPGFILHICCLVGASSGDETR